jgi:hypothetical protein
LYNYALGMDKSQQGCGVLEIIHPLETGHAPNSKRGLSPLPYIRRYGLNSWDWTARFDSVACRRSVKVAPNATSEKAFSPELKVRVVQEDSLEKTVVGRLATLLLVALIVWITRPTRTRRSAGKKGEQVPTYEKRWDKAERTQTYEQIRRQRNSYWVVMVAIICTEGVLWQPAPLLSSLGEWAETAFLGGLFMLMMLTWLILYLWDRRKSATQAPDENASER